jgi:pyridoxal phosphate enzyme (YggS family)
LAFSLLGGKGIIFYVDKIQIILIRISIFTPKLFTMEIGEEILAIKQNIPVNVKLVAVSKTKPNEDILSAYNTGHNVFGENKVQDLVSKFESLPKDIEWHFIGHPQSNKVKYIAPFVSLIHGVDSLKLLKVIDKEGSKNSRVVNCLLQFHIAAEATKFGLLIDEAKTILDSEEFKSLKFVKIAGVMGMATYTDNENQIKKEFSSLKNIFNLLKNEYFSDSKEFSEISMGMSGDYRLAIEEGSTMIRVGSKIFGNRNY